MKISVKIARIGLSDRYLVSTISGAPTVAIETGKISFRVVRVGDELLENEVENLSERHRVTVSRGR